MFVPEFSLLFISKNSENLDQKSNSKGSNESGCRYRLFLSVLPSNSLCFKWDINSIITLLVIQPTVRGLFL